MSTIIVNNAITIKVSLNKLVNFTAIIRHPSFFFFEEVKHCPSRVPHFNVRHCAITKVR